MVAGLLMLGADSVALVLEVSRAYDLRSGVRYSQEYVEEILLVGVDEGTG